MRKIHIFVSRDYEKATLRTALNVLEEWAPRELEYTTDISTDSNGDVFIITDGDSEEFVLDLSTSEMNNFNEDVFIYVTHGFWTAYKNGEHFVDIQGFMEEEF